MTSVSRWWTKQGSAARLDLFIRWSLYLISAVEPLAMLAIANRQEARPTGLAMLLLVSVATRGHVSRCCGPESPVSSEEGDPPPG